mmetsp:Transcript_30575/g.81834  ORF Transcript_30575/g.81834 Transcript_30575/m.81834 type:complete len:482 (+) Transcript_30575:537-1982(+)
MLRRGVQVGAELGESRHLAVLSELQLQGPGHLLHRLDLRRRAHAAHGEADVDGGPDTLVEQLRLQEDLPVCDADHVRGDVGAHVPSLGLDDRQRCQGATTHRLLVHLGRALEQAGVEVEHVARVGLTARGPAQQQGHLAVRDRLLGQVIVEDDRVLARVAKVLRHGAASVGRQELQGRGVGGRRRHDRSVLQAIVLAQDLEQLRHGGALLADGHVDAVQVQLRVGACVDGLLVQDGVDRDGGLARLPVADDELALPAADRDEAVDGLQSRGHGLVDALARDDAGRLQLDAAPLLGGDGPLAVDGRSQGVHYPAEKGVADGHVHDGAGALDAVALHDGTIVAEHHYADVVRLQVQGHALQAARELDHLARLHPLQAVDTGDAVPDAQHPANLLHVLLVREVGDAVTEDLCELRWAHLRRSPRRRRVQVARGARGHSATHRRAACEARRGSARQGPHREAGKRHGSGARRRRGGATGVCVLVT